MPRPGAAGAGAARTGADMLQTTRGEIAAALDAVLGGLPDGLAEWLVVPVAIALALTLHAALWRGLRRAASHGTPELARIVEIVRGPSRLFVVVLPLVVLVELSALPPVWREGLARLAVAILIVIVGWTVILAVGELVDRSTRRFRLEEEDNLAARKYVTQMRVLRRTAQIVLALLTAAAVLSTFEEVRRLGVSLFASAGAAGLVLGFAARPVLANLIAGVQIALTQPIRIQDVVIVEGEWGVIEEIAATYVVVKIWDLRRLVVPLSYFIETPFQNWTRDDAQVIGTVLWYLDYTAPVEAIRARFEEVVRASALWDGQVIALQVVDTDRDVIHLRGLMSARNAAIAWDLRCEVREAMVVWLQAKHPGALPRVRGEFDLRGAEAARPDPQRRRASGAPRGVVAPQRQRHECSAGKSKKASSASRSLARHATALG